MVTQAAKSAVAKESALRGMRVSDRVKTTFYVLAIAVGSVLALRVLTGMVSTTASNFIEFACTGLFFLLVMAWYKKANNIKVVW
jgi:uncharacterized YccA/Bax inhibitor family protein